MQHQEFPPPEALIDTIKCFWYNVKDFGDEQCSFEVQPDGFAEIIFYFGSLQSISANSNPPPLPSPFMMGLLNRPALFYTQNRLEIIGVRCYPWTVFDLLDMPAGKGGVCVFEHPIAQLQPMLGALLKAGQVKAAISELKKFFVAARSQATNDNTVFKAGSAMSQANGNMAVSEVAAAAHATVRTLERKFKQSSGHTVKDVSALMRFEQARNCLWHRPETNLASLAAKLGYADQSHLSREFKRFSGTTPAAFARKAKRIVGIDFVAFVQS